MLNATRTFVEHVREMQLPRFHLGNKKKKVHFNTRETQGRKNVFTALNAPTGRNTRTMLILSLFI